MSETETQTPTKAEDLETLLEDVQHLFEKINWSDSPMDARAIRVMNGLRPRIKELVERPS